MTQSFSRELPFGARLVSPDRTRFRLFAPAQQHVQVAIEGEGTRPMRRSNEGWFEVEAPCGAGTRYLYVLEDGSRVPDPASRGQESDVHDWSVVVDPAAYVWQRPDWR